MINNILKESIILHKQKDVQNILQMLKELNPIKSNLIFRASVDGLTAQNFHSKCDHKPHLLYLVQNEYGFRYGGYSPCEISIDRIGKYETDHSMTSFVFSLDTNTKAKVTKKEVAIENGWKSELREQLLLFGESWSCSLIIGVDSLEKKKTNWVQFYPKDDDGGYETFEQPPKDVECCGKEYLESCRLREVQVYQLEFQKKE